MGRELGCGASDRHGEPLRCVQGSPAHGRDTCEKEDEPAMNWDDRIITERELHDYREDENDARLEAYVAALIDQQYEAWPLFREGRDAFEHIETKRVPVEESEVV